MRFSTLFSFIPVAIFAQKEDDLGRYYMCIFGPDSLDQYHEEIVNEEHAKSCDKFCVCNELKTTCLVGPDSICNFATVEVDRNFADFCDRESCTCTSHADYMLTANDRLSGGGVCKSTRTSSGGGTTNDP